MIEKKYITDNIKILIVDDDTDILDSLRDLIELENTNHIIKITDNVDTAEKISNTFLPDIALIDIKIGTDNGITLLSKLKNNNKNITCIMMTAFRETDYAVNAIKNGADDYIFKPINPDYFLSTINHHIKNIKDNKITKSHETFVKNIFKNTNNLLFLIDQNEIVIDSNYSELNSYKKKIINENFYSLPLWSCSSNKNLIKEKINQSIIGGSVEFEITEKDINRRDIYYIIKINPVIDSQQSTPMVIAEVKNITEEVNNKNNIEALAFYDSLTGLANRRMFMVNFEQNLASSQRHNIQSALLFLDLDNFKEINDSLGHQVGDNLLQQVAERLVLSVRNEDIVARLGGDEFVILLPMLNIDPEIAAYKAKVVAEKIRHELSQPYKLDNQAKQVSSSIGIVLFPEMGDTLKKLINSADTAMYHSKKSGRNRTSIFNKNLQEKENNRLTLEQEIIPAIEQRQFQLYFQPICDINGNLLILETLIRWHHPKLGVLMPNDFIHIVDKTGKTLDLYQWIITEACQVTSQHTNTRLSINFNPHIFNHSHATETIINTIDESNIEPSRLIFEITEKLIDTSPIEALQKIDTLNKYGILFSIDDFGQSVGSLSHLTQFPFSQVKLASSITQQLSSNPAKQRFLEASIAMSNAIGVEVIAKNIESQEQLTLLSKTKFYGYQGYYLASPVPVEQLLDERSLKKVFTL